MLASLEYKNENIDTRENLELLSEENLKNGNERMEWEKMNRNSGIPQKPLQVLVFTNTAQQANKAFQFLSNSAEQLPNQEQFSPVNQNNSSQLDKRTLIDISRKFNWKDKCAELHKDVPVEQRLESLERFKSGDLKVLVCTDIASRGLDILDVSHVIQLDFASNAAYVLHRAGRTARAGAHGKGIDSWVIEGECFGIRY